MKKLLVLVFALVLVVSLASVSLAVGTTLADGKVEVSLSNSVFGQKLEGNLSFDLTKTYSEQLSAGATIKVKPAENIDGLAYVKRAADATEAPDGTIETITVDGVNYDLLAKSMDAASAAAFDGAGWVKFNYSPVVVTAKTSIDGNAANALGVLHGSASGAGVQVDYTVIEGATVTVMGNSNEGFNYLAKGVYSGNGLTIGAGYQAGTSTNDVVAAWASYKLGTVTVGGEYANRLTEEDTAMLATVAATFGPATVNGKFLNKTEGFTNFDGDPDGYIAYDRFLDVEAAGSAIAVDATFKATDALSVYGNFQMVLEGETSYKAGLTYALSDSLKADASYKALDDTNAVNVTVTDTFAAGLVGSLSLDMDLAAETQSYTAKVTATL